MHRVMMRDVRRGLSRKIRTESNGGFGFRTASCGHELADVEVTIDVDRIAAYISQRAMSNKTNQAVLFGVKARVLKRRRFEEPVALLPGDKPMD